MKISFYTLGCKVNQYETQSMIECFKKEGHEIVPDSVVPDVFIINSCTVTAESDRKTRQMLHRYRQKYPSAVLVLCGCMPQAFPTGANLLLDADIVVGNTDHKEIPHLVDKFLKDGERIFSVSGHTKAEHYNTPAITEFEGRTRAFMKIEDGCDRFCTYCVIPRARGFIRSKKCDEIKTEAQKLADNGYSEIVLVGINLSSFGKDTGENLADAVDAVCSVDNIKRVRLGSLEPDLMSDELLERLKQQEKFCPQFHLSLQSGCDSTLKRMNRRYDSAFYYDLVCRIRRIFDNPSITTDIMVGFAGETGEEFTESIQFVKKVGFALSHVFAYSRRQGTVAANLPNQVTRAVKSQRSREMIAATKQSKSEFYESQIGKTSEVLFETVEGDEYFGYTENYTPIKLKSDKNLCGSTVKVKIVSNELDFCVGEKCE